MYIVLLGWGDEDDAVAADKEHFGLAAVDLVSAESGGGVQREGREAGGRRTLGCDGVPSSAMSTRCIVSSTAERTRFMWAS